MKTKGKDTYAQFIEQKAITAVPTGFEPGAMPSGLFEFQCDIAKWACRKGRAALFEDCGLGKTVQELAWCDQVLRQVGGPVLVLAPIGVTHQHVREGKKFGFDNVRIVSSQSEVQAHAINVTNYEKLHRFDLSEVKGIVVDESSILKSVDGATRNALIERTAHIAHKMAGTATPSPNDYMEIGNHSEFLGVMTRTEMLATFFVHDGGDTAQWRLKGHAEVEFWKWLCSWAVNIRKPSDLGYEDGMFKLPSLRMHQHIVASSQKMDGYLFALPASTLQERREARRGSIDERVEAAAALASDNEQWVFWCNLNSESEALAKRLGAVEVRGSTTEEERERIVLGFLDGSIKRVVSKPSLWGFGLNLQCCHRTAFVGLSDSFEQFYQAVRRFWRFGQRHPVDAHIIISEAEGAVLANIKRKEADATRMADEMVRHMADISAGEIHSTRRTVGEYCPTVPMRLPEFLKQA